MSIWEKGYSSRDVKIRRETEVEKANERIVHLSFCIKSLVFKQNIVNERNAMEINM